MNNNTDWKFLISLGQQLKAARLEKSMSLRDLAQKCHLDNSKISKIENGKINITISTLSQLAEALDVPVKQLINF